MEIKFRPSSIWKLMVEPRSKSESLSETTKTYLEELYIENEYDRQKDFYIKYADKGNVCEPDSIKLLSEIDGVEYVKNMKHFSNDYLFGTPDIVSPILIDIKTSWDIWTFKNAELKKEYYWQLQCYMWLTDFKTSQLIYTLVNTPEYIIQAEQKRAWNNLIYKEAIRGIDEVEFNDEIAKNLTYDDIPKELRVKRFECEFDPQNISKILNKIVLAKEYYKTIKL
jgi:hypothetical protein